MTLSTPLGQFWGPVTCTSLLQVSDVIDMKQDELTPTVLTVVLSEERGHVYQFQTTHDLAVFRLRAVSLILLALAT